MEHDSGVSVEGSNANRDDQTINPKHKVFLSHSGAQKGFVEQLCLDLERWDRYPFFDIRRDSLPIGENFPNLIFNAIKQCQVGVVVLSEQYFTRTKWPMLELVALVNAKKENASLIIMPVFLGISSNDCWNEVKRNQWLSVWRGWAEVDRRINIQEWKTALEIFGPTNNISCKDGLGEVKCREEIVEAICKIVSAETRWDDSHVQGRTRLCKMIREKIDGSHVSGSYGVRLMGLYGVGGIGKTTACKSLCNDLFVEFRGLVCHAELEKGSELELLREVLKRLTNTRHELLIGFNIDECRNRLINGINKQRVFLAIDNLSDSVKTIDQAETFLRADYAEGSVVMVTARSLGQLEMLNIDKSDCIEMPELEDDEARSLFLYHAAPGLYFKNECSKNVELIMLCVKRCHFYKGDGSSHHYHPLALKVLGVQLGFDPKKWVVKLDELDIFNPLRDKEHPIFSILRKSFDTLICEDQLLFMDATLFCTEDEFDMKRINLFQWLSIVHGVTTNEVIRRLKSLKRKSVIENLGDGSTKIGMHDLWREFCVMETKVGKLKHRRWIYEVSNSFYDRQRPESWASGGGWKTLQRICLMRMCIPYGAIEVIFNGCSNIAVLKVVDVRLEDEVLDVSLLKHLKSMECKNMKTVDGDQVKVIGIGFLRHLVVLIWDNISTDSSCLEKIGCLKNLQVLQLDSSFKINKMPDLSQLSLLQQVAFHRWNGADTIAGLNSKMTNLQLLDLRWCRWLRSCPSVGDLVALHELNLQGCSKLKHLPNLQRLTRLQKLDLTGCKLIKALFGVGDLVTLEVLKAQGCLDLAELPDMSKLTNLQVLNLFGCRSIKTVPGLSDLIDVQEFWGYFGMLEDWPDLQKLTKLQTVNIWGWSTEGLLCLTNLVNLECLTISDSQGVDELAGLSRFTRLKRFRIQSCEFKYVSGLINLTALQHITISRCSKLESLPALHKLTRLETLYIWSCKGLRPWEKASGFTSLLGLDSHNIGLQLPQLKTLDFLNLPITELPDLSNFPCLKQLWLRNCGGLVRLTSTVPLTALENLVLDGCWSLKELPDFSHSMRLRYFGLQKCGVQLNVQEMGDLKAMCPELEINCNTESESYPSMALTSEGQDDLHLVTEIYQRPPRGRRMKTFKSFILGCK